MAYLYSLPRDSASPTLTSLLGSSEDGFFFRVLMSNRLLPSQLHACTDLPQPESSTPKKSPILAHQNRSMGFVLNVYSFKYISLHFFFLLSGIPPTRLQTALLPYFSTSPKSLVQC